MYTHTYTKKCVHIHVHMHIQRNIILYIYNFDASLKISVGMISISFSKKGKKICQAVVDNCQCLVSWSKSFSFQFFPLKTYLKEIRGNSLIS
jgi:hypothetical protein